MVEQFGSQGQIESFADTILPRRPVAGEDGFRTRGLEPLADAGEPGVPVVNQVTDAWTVHEDLAKLLAHPGRGRGGGDSEVEDPAPVVMDDDEAVQELECRSGDRHEVHGRHLRHMVLEESLPASDFVWIRWTLRHVPRDGDLGDIYAQLQEFGVDARCAPGVLCCHSADEDPEFPGDTRTAGVFA